MCVIHTLPYPSHKLFKIMFLLEQFTQIQLYKLYQQCLGFNYGVFSSCQPFPSIYNLTICRRIIFTRFEALKYILFEW